MEYWTKTHQAMYSYQMQPQFHAETRVLACLCSKASRVNTVYITQGEIGELLGLHKSSVIRAVKELRIQDLVRLVRRSVYMLNPDYVSYGDGYAAAAMWRKLDKVSDSGNR